MANRNYRGGTHYNFENEQLIITKNNAISRNTMDDAYYQQRSIMFGEITRSQLCPVTRQSMAFFRIKGISSFWKEEEAFDVNAVMSDLLCGLNKNELGYAYIIKGDKHGISVNIGIDERYKDSLRSSLISMFPNIELEDTKLQEIVPDDFNLTDGGIMTGLPTNKLSEKTTSDVQLDYIIRGMQGKEFIYVVYATGIAPGQVTAWYNDLLQEMSVAYEYQKSGTTDAGTTIDKQSFIHTRYFENLEKLEVTFRTGIERGMWYYSCYFGVRNESSAEIFGNILRSSFSGQDSAPDRMRTFFPMESRMIQWFIRNKAFILELNGDNDVHPLGRGTAYKYQTVVNSDQLGVLSALPIKEYPGYYIDNYVEFDVSNRHRLQIENPVPIGDIVRAGRAQVSEIKNIYTIEQNDYTRHCLIIGITGGGKTNTSKSLLRTLWCQKKIPFLVIESAKREYWELRNLEGFEQLQVFTLGSEEPGKAVRYRINPFETNPGISLQTHIDMLLATFKTAFELFPPMPYVLESAVYEVYKDRGWNIVTNRNDYGLTLYPTISDLYDKIGYIVQNMGYDNEVSSNIRSALEARINSLMIGGKGAMLNTPHSIPIESLLSAPSVLELEDIGDDETKSFVIGILLVQLYEYRKYQKDRINGAKKLQHILMVEEAHRLLKNVSESSNPAQAKSVEFFCNMLAEIRTYGQGIFIADQIPTKLAPDTIKNTNLKIVHRTVAMEDREAMGRAMNMSEDQIEYLSSLPRGYAAVYAEGDNRPKCVKLPLVKDQYNLSREEVIKPIREKVDASLIDDMKPLHCGCTYCEKKCLYGKTFTDDFGKISFRQGIGMLKKDNYKPETITYIINYLEKEGHISITDKWSRLCAAGFILDTCGIEKGLIKKIISQYLGSIH